MRLALAAAAALALSLAAALAQETAAPTPAPGPKHFKLVTVGDGIYAAIAKESDPTALGNAGFVIGSDAVLVVDTFATTVAAEELSAEIKKLTPLPVRWVVNTHYHYDHLGGDAVFAAQGAGIIAHENVRAWVRTENLKWRKELTAEDKEMLARLVLPSVTYRDALTIWLGDRKVEVFSRPGHTGGDSVVFVPSSKVVFCGDLFWRETIPNMIDASSEAWVDTLDGFLRTYPSATFVPGHGEVGKALEVRFFRDYVSGLRLGVARSVAEGKSGKDLVDSLLALQRARFGTWAWFDNFSRSATSSSPSRRSREPRSFPSRSPRRTETTRAARSVSPAPPAAASARRPSSSHRVGRRSERARIARRRREGGDAVHVDEEHVVRRRVERQAEPSLRIRRGCGRPQNVFSAGTASDAHARDGVALCVGHASFDGRAGVPRRAGRPPSAAGQSRTPRRGGDGQSASRHVGGIVSAAGVCHDRAGGRPGRERQRRSSTSPSA